MKLNQAEEKGDNELVIIRVLGVAGLLLQEIVCRGTDDVQNFYLHATCHEDKNMQPSPKPFIPSLLLPVDRSSL